MRSSIGNSLLLSLVVIIVSLVILVFINVLSYSKAYRVKNRIIEIIEKHEKFDSDSKDEIKKFLKQAGYQVGTCPLNDDFNKDNGYKYCVSEFTADNDGKYYKVTAYVEYNFPVIDKLLTTAVSGETRIIGRKIGGNN